MTPRPGIRLALAGCAAGILAACQSTAPVDRSAIYADMPRSILVLPPLNESLDANAGYSLLSTLSKPLGEQGYYVYPVAVVDAYMKDNGLPDATEMHAVPLAKLREIFDPDAVLYMTVEQFGQKYEVLSSTTRIDARGTLIDADSGTELWSGEMRYSEGNESAGGGLLSEIIGAALAQATSTVNDASHDAAKYASRQFVSDPDSGLPVGPLHPDYVMPGSATDDGVAGD